MPTVVRAVDFVGPDGKVTQGIEVIDLLAANGPYKTGRWVKLPSDEEPDRCDWCELADIKAAIGSVTIGGYKRGYCQAHEEKARKEASA